MEINLPKGKYVVAVSGGVDSVVLLDLVSQLDFVKELPPVVAHFDHGIRPDSSKDLEFVKSLADYYGYQFESEAAKLGPNASEEQARNARYKFLTHVQNMYKAKGIVLAHHKNDINETVMINILRGSGRRGVSSFKSTQNLIRPLLGYSKQQILSYAKSNNLEWREDSTNTNPKYLRNKLRLELDKSKDVQESIYQIHNQLKKINTKADKYVKQITDYVYDEGSISRFRFSSLPFNVGSEVLLQIFSSIKINNIDRRLINDANVAVRTLKIGKKFVLDKHCHLLSEKNFVVIKGHKI